MTDEEEGMVRELVESADLTAKIWREIAFARSKQAEYRKWEWETRNDPMWEED